MDYFDRPNANELLEAVSSLIDELNINPKEINNFKIHINFITLKKSMFLIYIIS